MVHGASSDYESNYCLKNMTDKYQLKIDSHVVIQLGSELISDSEQALLELVKNAYDGDATKCVISLEPTWNPEKTHKWYPHLESFKALRPDMKDVGRIVVRDDGTGLDTSAIDNGWLFISASLKRNSSGSKTSTIGGRIPVGDKGLGRLATMRLGDVLYLRTMTKNEPKARAVSFAWSAFSSGNALEEIDVKSELELPPLKNRKHGTDIEVLGLLEPEYWSNESKLNAVISKLSTLISPFEKFKDFQVNIKSNEQQYDLQAISAEALNFASTKFEFNYDNSKLKIKAYIAKSLFRGASGFKNREEFDRIFADSNLPGLLKIFESHPKIKKRGFNNLLNKPGGWLFSLEEEIDWKDIPRDPKLPGAIDPGQFYGEIYNFLFNDHTKEQLVAANVPLGLLQGMTTIGLFRDKFRVRMNDDWLELSKGVTSGGFFQLRPRNVIGYFAISNELNPNLIEKSDREGFVDNESWRGFLLLANRAKKFANDSLDLVRTAYDEYKSPKDSKNNTITSIPAGKVQDLIHDQKAKTTNSIDNLMERSDAITGTINSTKQRIQELKVEGSFSQPSLNILIKELEDVGKQLEAVKDAASNVKGVTHESFNATSGFAQAHQQLYEQNLRLLDAAAVGLSARALVHEINTHLGNLNRGLAIITRVNKENSDEKITRALSGISSVLRELKKSISNIDPLTPGSRSLKDIFNVRDAIESFFRQRTSRLSELKVIYTLSEKKGASIKFSKVRFAQILENLLQNSLYWIDEHSVNDSSVKRTINVEFNDYGFIWSDGAMGVREAVEDTIFDAYVTDKPDSKGQGLGLFIVTAFLQAEKCGIALLEDRNSNNRRFKFGVDLSGAIQ